MRQSKRGDAKGIEFTAQIPQGFNRRFARL